MKQFALLIPLLATTLLQGAPAMDTAEYWLSHPVSPKAVYEQLRHNPNLKENNNGEPFAWHSAGGGAFIDGYKVWGETEWLDYAVRYYTFLLDQMRVAPDGYKGLLGRNFRNDLLADEQVSDALVMGPLLRFAELVLKDEQLREAYGPVASQYVEHAKKHVIEKWDARGLWHEIDQYGDYIFGNQYVDPSNPGQWVRSSTDRIEGMSQKFNIANKLGLVSIYLYRITGDPSYRDRAEKLFYRLKSNFQLVDNAFTWHYWTPFWEKDVLFDQNRLIHWSSVHPYRPHYQAEEVRQIVEAYHSGIVFSRTDIERIRNMNIEQMWNGDLEDPQFSNSNGQKPVVTEAALAFDKAKGGSGAANKGTLWSALVDVDETVRRLYEPSLLNPASPAARVRTAYYFTQIKPVPATYERRYADHLPVIEKTVPLGTSKDLVLGTVIPHVIRKGTDSVLLAKAIRSGPLSIDLYSIDGTTRIQNIYTGDIIGDWDGQKGFRMVKWDGTDPTGSLQFDGDYLVRWNFIDGYRLYAIRITDCSAHD